MDNPRSRLPRNLGIAMMGLPRFDGRLLHGDGCASPR
jgi:hypothetical protein